MANQKITFSMVEAMAAQLIAIKTQNDFFHFVGGQFEPVFNIPQNKRYNIFKVPKRNNKWRQIEDPIPELKELQRIILRYLQSVYSLVMPDCSYGFILSVEGREQKNIYTNACKHLGMEYLINMDIEDYFFSIKTKQVKELFCSAPFQFNEELADMLTNICTINGHLPTGAPTSPVLSNLVCLGMDSKIESLCRGASIHYTRFVDDITLSSSSPIHSEILKYIQDCILEEKFLLNLSKFKKYGPKDVKEVTGLVLKKKPDVTDLFLLELRKNIDDFCHLKKVNHYLLETGKKNSNEETPAYGKLHQSIEGALNFLKSIRGSKDQTYRELKEQMSLGFIENAYLLKGYYTMAF